MDKMGWKSIDKLPAIIIADYDLLNKKKSDWIYTLKKDRSQDLQAAKGETK